MNYLCIFKLIGQETIKCASARLALAVAVGIQHGFVGHQDRPRVAGALAEAAAHNAEEGLNDPHFAVLRRPEDILRADLQALAAAVA